MQITGEQRIAAPRQRVWEALNDPEVLRACIPGCQSLERAGEDRFDAAAEVKIGPIGARFKGVVQLTDLDPPHGYTIVGEGSGGVAGNAKGGAKVRLSENREGTLISYDVDAQVGGRLAQLGGPIIDATAKQLSGKFFAKFAEVVGAVPAAPSAEHTMAATASLPSAVAATVPYPPVAAPTIPEGFPWAWVVSVAVALLGGFLLGRSNAGDIWLVGVIVLIVIVACAAYETGRRARPL